MQMDLYDQAKRRLKANTVLANSLEEVKSILRDVTAEKGGGKFVMAHIKDEPACDARSKESSRPRFGVFRWPTNATAPENASSPASRWTAAP
jgi:hypothetical protein